MPNEPKKTDTDTPLATEDLKDLEKQVVAELGGTLPTETKVEEFKKRIAELEAVYNRLENKIQTKKTEIKAGLERLKALKAELAKEIDEVKNLEVIEQKIKEEISHLETLQAEINKAEI